MDIEDTKVVVTVTSCVLLAGMVIGFLLGKSKNGNQEQCE